MSNWDDYRFILALDRCGTLRSAATMLGVNHSTLSRRLAAINTRHSQPVFEKTIGRYTPTALGKELVEAAKSIETIDFAIQRQEKALGVALSGPVTLSLPAVLAQHILMKPLLRFTRENPNIQLTIKSSYTFANLDRLEADIAVRGFDTPPEHLVGRRLFAYGLSYYCHKDYFETVSPEKRCWITGTMSTDWIATSPFPDIPIGVQIDDIELRHQAALMKAGMLYGACYMADTQPDLMRLPGADVMRGQDFWVLTHPDLKEIPRIKFVMQFIASVMMKHRPLIEGKTE